MHAANFIGLGQRHVGLPPGRRNRVRGQSPAGVRPPDQLDHPAKSIVGLGLFALSPVPSGQLFVAAGLMRVALLPLTVAFFAGRVVSYTIYVTGASAIKDTFGDQVIDSLTSPLGIALQLCSASAPRDPGPVGLGGHPRAKSGEPWQREAPA
jgi:hypothetical protein